MTEDSVRHPRGFEPPPWEAEQFEQLARQRAADEEAQRRLTEAASASSAAAEKAAAEAATVAAARADEPAAAPPAAVAADVMLLDLRAEEPRALRGAWIVPMIAGVPIVLMGLAMAAMGVLGAVGGRANTSERSLVSGLFVVGALALLSLGGWLVAKSLKTRSIGG